MSVLKINENQFLGKSEYSRLMEFLQKHGVDRKFLLNSNSFGLFEDFYLPEFGQILKKDCFYVRKSGTPYDEIVIQKGVAVDSDANIIINKDDINVQIPSDNLWYWVKIKHNFSSIENGTVDIDQFGNLTGIGTEFTKILRGQPNFPTKIRLFNSLNGNVYDYEVVKIINDTSCVLYGDFNSETNLKFGVVGTFTPGFNVPIDYKFIYQFDSCSIELIQETTLGSPPTFQSYKEFYLSRVKNNGIDLTIQDKRIEWFKTNLANKMENLDRVNLNPLIGVESVKYDVQTSTKDKNIIELSFGFRVQSFTIDTSSKKISVLIGNGGSYKTTSNFLAGDFDGWRIYFKNGRWAEIIDSQKSGSQIVLTLDTLIPDYIVSNDSLFIAPPYEEVEIKSFIPGLTDSNQIDKFNINTPLCRFKLNSFDSCVLYNMSYRYKTNLGYTDWFQFPDDIIGHYAETSFEINGDLKPVVTDRTQIPYTASLTSGFIKVCEHPNSYDNFQQLIDIGDKFGVNTTKLENSNPLINLIVGRDKKYQHFKDQITLSADIFIVLRSTKENGNPLREGNEFFLHFEQDISLNTFKIRIVQNFVDPTNYELITTINENDCAFIKNNTNTEETPNVKRGMFMTLTFNDLGKWICHYITDVTPKNTIRTLSSVPSSAFIANNGVKAGYWGWRLMVEMDSKFIMGTSNITTVGQNPIRGTGGQNMKTLLLANMPSHNHGWTGQAGDGWPDGSGDRTGAGGMNSYVRQTMIQSQGGGQPFDVRPAYISFVQIEKIV